MVGYVRSGVVLLTALAMLAACTKEVPREPIDVRHYRLDWEALNVPELAWNGLSARGVVLTPAQWPLEGSLKRLLSGDFLGTIEGLDLTFHSATIPTGILQELYAEGYLPAYVRVENAGDAPAHFDPRWLIVRADDITVLTPVNAEELPLTLKRIDWLRTGTAVVAVALLAALAASGKDRSGANEKFVRGGFNLPVMRTTESPQFAAPPPQPHDTGLLKPAVLQPGDVREGFVLFTLDQSVSDWSTVRLAVNR